jgi:hypothetical protein
MARKAEGPTLQRDPRTNKLITQFRIAGRKYRRSTGCTDKAEAKVEANRIYKEELARATKKLVGNPIIAELFDQWLDDIDGTVSERYWTTQAKRTVLLAERFESVSDVTPHAVRGYIKERLKSVTATTVRRDLVPLRECLRWAFDEGLIDQPPFIPLPKKRARGTRAIDTRRVGLTDAQVESLLRALPERTRKGHPIRDLFTVAWDTGLRHDGIFRLEAGRHFRLDRRTLQVTKDIDKNGYERELPLTNRAYESLAAQGVDIGPIFQRWDYRKSLRTAAKSLGLDPDDLKSLDMRDFRHAATDDGARKSGHLSGLAYMAGHTDKHTTSRYIHPQIDDAREVLNKRFPSNGTPSGTRTGGGEGSQ